MAPPRLTRLALALALGPLAVLAADTARTWAGWQIPAAKVEERGALAIVEDTTAETTREVAAPDGAKRQEHVALEQRVSRQAIAKAGAIIARTPTIKWDELEPGVYDITARVSFQGDLGVFGTPIVLGAYGEGRPAETISYSPCDFTETEVYQELTLRYEVAPGGSKRLQARAPRHTARSAAWFREAYPELPAPEAKPVKSTGFRIELHLPQTKYNVQSGEPPNSLRLVRLDWLKLARVQPSPSLTVRHVRAERLWLRPGEAQTFQIGLENFTAAPHTRTLVVTLERGFASRQELPRQEITLAPGAAQTVTLPWPTTAETPPWGYAVIAEIRQGDTVESSARDVFSLSPHVYPVHIMGANSRRNDPFRENENYQNLVEVFGATFGDSAGVTPRNGDRWISGMSSGGVFHSYKLCQAMTQGNRRQGIATHMYLFAGGTSMPLMDLAVEHPEWLGSRPLATDDIYQMNADRLAAVEQWDFSKGPLEPQLAKVQHTEVHLNHWFPELRQRIEQQTLEFVRQSGYEGIRFDVGIFAPQTTTTVLGTKLPYDMKDAMAHAAANFNSYKDKLRAAFPHFEFGANMDSWAYLEQVGNRNVTPKPPEEYPEFVAFAQAGGMFMDEGSMSAPFYDHYMNRWEDALWAMAQKRDMAARFGGVYQLFSPHRDGNGYFAHDDVYFAIMILASGSHYVGNFAAPPYTRASMGEFATRFSEYFWSPARRLLPDAQNLVYVDAPAEVWYADVTTAEPLGEKLRYVVPLINPPVAERLRRNKTNELPPPILEPFKIEVKLPNRYQQAQATMLTWEPDLAAQPLPTTVANGKATLTFPALHLFRTLVVEFSR
jgi:hypothetical protein